MPQRNDVGLRRGRLSANRSPLWIKMAWLSLSSDEPIDLIGRRDRFGDRPPAAEETWRRCGSALQLPHRWRDEAIKAGHAINQIAIAYEVGREGEDGSARC